ncbi:MerR family transcriptional regulator [Winogradskyella sp. F6397]|uniref:MerR family transcriptional regulator n=1 Tax=Winogradskyella marina TaxID=2785530 RepID=A0ABS0EPE4_9FLAO|nr:MerR family transcriptional regulator [Winogradskyella marina]MBF8151320.1 MerR family transcriptional regulator [Winogradskyella marina]
MNNIKDKFSIKDLENLTGIKAHTIRIWEKRYNLLEPKRTETNIRYYDLASFQKLLNVSYLNNNGYKISKIATIASDKIPALVKEIAAESNTDNHAINAFKLSMLNFDQSLFYKTYKSLLSEKTFEEIFYNIFIPLLTEIGLLWQTDTITPAHEHFISQLIRQKILINTEKLQENQNYNSDKTFVLYLPDNEIHDIGLTYINHEVIRHGYRSIYLGQSIPIESLIDLKNYYNNIVFISYFTIKPEKENLSDYFQKFSDLILTSPDTEFWVLGSMLSYIDKDKLPKQVKAFSSIKSFTNTLEN